MLAEKEIAFILAENNKLKKLEIQQEEPPFKKEKVISEQDAKISEKEGIIAETRALIARLQRMLFGQKRERFESPTNQLDIFQEISSEKQERLEQQAAEKIEVTYQREKKVHPGWFSPLIGRHFLGLV